MVDSSCLFTSQKLLERILGKSTRTIQRLKHASNEIRLNAQQSAVAFHYANVLEASAMTFGSVTSAEHWLKSPCIRLSGIIPYEAVDTALGFSLVMDYLERIRLGVYQ
ncbi:DUF2384 domain-containing protein [Pseudomonas sp. BN505]|nr:DUF2384 domain-containing protein [Pseudomonas sp. BN605]MDH4859568.1 DUF2384 domain-containing protein [Pseudomonas sp. BN505]